MLECWCGRYGKAACNSVTKAVMIEFPGAAPMCLVFALLSRGVFSPKVSCYFGYELSDRTAQPHDVDELEYPFFITCAVASSRVSPHESVCEVITSDELSLKLARAGRIAASRCFELIYRMPPHDTDLLSMEVLGEIKIADRKGGSFRQH